MNRPLMPQYKNIEFVVEHYIKEYGIKYVRDILSCSISWLDKHRYYYVVIDWMGVVRYRRATRTEYFKQ